MISTSDEELAISPADALLLAPAIAQGDKKALAIGLAKIVGGSRAEAVASALVNWKNRNDRLFQEFLRALEAEEGEQSRADLVARVVRSALAGKLDEIHRAVEQTQESLDAITIATRKTQIAVEEQASTLHHLVEGELSRVGADIHHSLDRLKLQLDRDRPSEVLEELANLRARVWHTAAPDVRARIVGLEGIAELHLGRDKKGAQLLLQALSEDPSGTRSLQHAALGYSVLGNSSKAMEFSQKVLQREPRNTTALQIIVLSDPRENLAELRTDLEKDSLLLPETLFALGQRAYSARNLDEARRYFSSALEGDPECRNYQAMSSIVEIEYIGEASAGRPTPGQRTTLLAHAERLAQFWRNLTDSQVKAARLNWLHALTLAEHLCRSTGAVSHSEALLEFRPDDEQFLTLRVAILSSEERPQEALEILKKLQSAGGVDDGLTAAVFANAGQHDEALRIWERLLARGEGTPQDRENYCRTLVRLGQAPKALAFANSERNKAPVTAAVLLLAAECAKAAEATTTLDEVLSTVAALSPADLSGPDVIACALLLLNEGRYQVAAKFYQETLVRDPSETMAFRYAQALLQARLYGDLFEFVTQESGRYSSLTEFAVAANEQLGNLPEARQICVRHLEEHDDVHMRMRYCAILFREEQREELAAQLTQIELFDHDWSPHELANLSAFLASVGRQVDALELQLRNMEQHEEAEAYARYFAAYFEWREFIPEKGVVDEDCSVRLDGVGAPEWIRIVRDQKRATTLQNTYAAAHDLSKALLGKVVGEDVASAGAPERPWRVAEILSSYAFAADHVRRNFSSFFPLSGDIQQFEVDVDQGTFIEQTERRLRKQDQASDHVRQIYARGTIPLSTLGRALHRDVIEAIGAALSSPSGLLAHPLAESERPLNYEPNTSVVFDLSSLVCLSLVAGLPISEPLGNVQSVIAQSTLDELRRWRDKTTNIRGERLSMGLLDGRIATFRESPEELQARRAFVDEQLAWLAKNAEVKGVPPDAAQRWHLQQEQASLFEGCNLDSFLIATNEQLLVSDDFALRRFVAPALNVQAISSLGWLTHLRRTGGLADEAFYTCSLRLLGAGYQQVPVSADLLWHARNSRELHLFRAAVRGLEGPSVTTESAAAVAAEFLKREALEPTDVQGELMRFDLICFAVVKGRRADAALRLLQRAAASSLSLLPLQLQEFTRRIRSWADTNQLRF